MNHKWSRITVFAMICYCFWCGLQYCFVFLSMIKKTFSFNLWKIWMPHLLYIYIFIFICEEQISLCLEMCTNAKQLLCMYWEQGQTLNVKQTVLSWMVAIDRGGYVVMWYVYAVVEYWLQLQRKVNKHRLICKKKICVWSVSHREQVNITLHVKCDVSRRCSVYSRRWGHCHRRAHSWRLQPYFPRLLFSRIL